jgi:hypothetical protein
MSSVEIARPDKCTLGFVSDTPILSVQATSCPSQTQNFPSFFALTFITPFDLENGAYGAWTSQKCAAPLTRNIVNYCSRFASMNPADLVV